MFIPAGYDEESIECSPKKDILDCLKGYKGKRGVLVLDERGEQDHVATMSGNLRNVNHKICDVMDGWEEQPGVTPEDRAIAKDFEKRREDKRQAGKLFMKIINDDNVTKQAKG